MGPIRSLDQSWLLASLTCWAVGTATSWWRQEPWWCYLPRGGDLLTSRWQRPCCCGWWGSGSPPGLPWCGLRWGRPGRERGFVSMWEKLLGGLEFTWQRKRSIWMTSGIRTYLYLVWQGKKVLIISFCAFMWNYFSSLSESWYGSCHTNSSAKVNKHSILKESYQHSILIINI